MLFLPLLGLLGVELERGRTRCSVPLLMPSPPHSVIWERQATCSFGTVGDPNARQKVPHPSTIMLSCIWRVQDQRFETGRNFKRLHARDA